MKTVQKFDDQYLHRCQLMNANEILRFVDDFRQLHGHQQFNVTPINAPKKVSSKKMPSKLISMKVPEDLLRTFRAKAGLNNTPYQTQIKQLIMDWLMK